MYSKSLRPGSAVGKSARRQLCNREVAGSNRTDCLVVG